MTTANFGMTVEFVCSCGVRASISYTGNLLALVEHPLPICEDFARHISAQNVRWVKCRLCDSTVMLFLEDVPPFYRKGAVVHSKPLCMLRELLSVQEFFEIHRDAEPMTPPVLAIPVIPAERQGNDA